MVTTSIQAKNLKELQLEELVGSLRAHESILMEDKPPQRKKSNDGIEVEEANLCLMAKDDAKEVTFSNSCFSCKKIEIIFDNLLKDSETLSQKCLSQRYQLIEIKKQNEELQKWNEEYLQTIQNLKLANLKLSEQRDVLNTLPLETFEEKKSSRGTYK